MSSHVVIYLDQNYLSNMAKARLGCLKTDHDTRFWHSLFDDLKKTVLADRVACPKSAFHRAESGYDTRLEDEIRCVIEELSWGLQFRSFEDVREAQVEDAAFRFLGKSRADIETWRIAFESDPQAPVQSRMQDLGEIKGRVSVHIALSGEVIEHDRQLKREYVAGEDLVAKPGNVCYNLRDEVLAQKRNLISHLLLSGKAELIYNQWCSGLSIDQYTADINLGRLSGIWERLAEIGIKGTDTEARFCASEELLNTPYIDISSFINAAIAKHYPTRGCKGSDLYDIPILATALPYCGVVITDSFMKEILVKILRFDNKYKARIFSATRADRMAFQKFIRGL